ncbi:hypothetical protein SAMN02746041_03245 [Desulfacinum hydrothermale DSM 13146]|uniref:Uncharacterized protein n=1 Tax=Desulfacinum hydrothermale DSM 13146 TaxID=1121390 RepID=A0A1W1XXV4_9BACT|nr:DUF6166 domain-containing protein [Desulfacinum hydrothermale]SMC28371.1 hypothetical protein SAMN02746041_03245 [Desulfacinum hydrothermale DSM 13146]
MGIAGHFFPLQWQELSWYVKDPHTGSECYSLCHVLVSEYEGQPVVVLNNGANPGTNLKESANIVISLVALILENSPEEVVWFEYVPETDKFYNLLIPPEDFEPEVIWQPADPQVVEWLHGILPPLDSVVTDYDDVFDLDKKPSFYYPLGQFTIPWIPGRDFVMRAYNGRRFFNFSHRIVKHSPTGMAWGYRGSGPTDCALNILAHVAGNDIAKYPHIYTAFRDRFVAGLPEAGGKIPLETVVVFLEEKGFPAKKETLT